MQNGTEKTWHIWHVVCKGCFSILNLFLAFLYIICGLFTSYWKSLLHIIDLLIYLSVKELFYLYNFAVHINNFRQTAHHWRCLVTSQYLSSYKIIVICYFPFPFWDLDYIWVSDVDTSPIHLWPPRLSGNPDFFLCAITTLFRKSFSKSFQWILLYNST